MPIFLLFQPANQAVRQLGDAAGDGRQQLPRDGGAHAVERAAVGGAGRAAGRLAAQAAAAPRAPHLSRPALGARPGQSCDLDSEGQGPKTAHSAAFDLIETRP